MTGCVQKMYTFANVQYYIYAEIVGMKKAQKRADVIKGCSNNYHSLLKGVRAAISNSILFSKFLPSIFSTFTCPNASGRLLHFASLKTEVV